MAVSHTIIVTVVLSSLLVCGLADLCAPDCRGGSGLLPHPQVCNIFYQCSHGTAFLKHCPEGLEFSSTGLICDYPAQAGCTSDPARECGVAAPTQESEAPTTVSPKTCAPTCPWEGSYLPHPQDCTKFYICGGGKVAYETNCQPGLHYDMKLSACEYPEKAFCIASPERACDENLRVY